MGQFSQLDPSPKAWETILAGSIPVLEHSALDDAYGELPVRNHCINPFLFFR